MTTAQKAARRRKRLTKYRKTWPSLGTYPGVDAGATGACKANIKENKPWAKPCKNYGE